MLYTFSRSSRNNLFNPFPRPIYLLYLGRFYNKFYPEHFIFRLFTWSNILPIWIYQMYKMRLMPWCGPSFLCIFNKFENNSTFVKRWIIGIYGLFLAKYSIYLIFFEISSQPTKPFQVKYYKALGFIPEANLWLFHIWDSFIS